MTYRHRFDTASGPADFPGALVQPTLGTPFGGGRNPQAFVEHVDYPNQASLHRRMLPNLVFVLNSVFTFTRSSIATRVNEAGLIEYVTADQARMDYDPITLQKKGLLIEETRRNLLTRSNSFPPWTPTGVIVSASTKFHIFASEVVRLVTANGTSTAKLLRRNMSGNSPNMTASVFLRRGTNNFAQICFTGDNISFANFDLLTGAVGSQSAAVTSTMIL